MVSSSLSACRTHHFQGNFQAYKEQQLLLLLVQQLADALFVRADHRLGERLWQEVDALGIDPDRVIRLLYCGQDPEDMETLREIDNARPRTASRIRHFRRWFGSLRLPHRQPDHKRGLSPAAA